MASALRTQLTAPRLESAPVAGATVTGLARTSRNETDPRSCGSRSTTGRTHAATSAVTPLTVRSPWATPSTDSETPNVRSAEGGIDSSRVTSVLEMGTEPAEEAHPTVKTKKPTLRRLMVPSYHRKLSSGSRIERLSTCRETQLSDCRDLASGQGEVPLSGGAIGSTQGRSGLPQARRDTRTGRRFRRAAGPCRPSASPSPSPLGRAQQPNRDRRAG